MRGHAHPLWDLPPAGIGWWRVLRRQAVVRRSSHLTQFYTASRKGEEDVVKEGDDVEESKQIPAGIMTVNGGFVVRYGIFFDNLRGDPLPFEEGVRRCIPYEDARMMSKSNSGRASSMWSWTPLSEIDGNIPEDEAPAQPRLWRLYYNLWNWGIMLYVAELANAARTMSEPLLRQLKTEVQRIKSYKTEEIPQSNLIQKALLRDSGPVEGVGTRRKSLSTCTLQMDARADPAGIAEWYAAVSALQLEFMEDKIHLNVDETVRSDVFDLWSREFEELKTKQSLKNAATRGSQGARMRWVSGPSAPFDNGTSLLDASEEEDGYHMVGIRKNFQKFMQFNLRGTLLQCSSLPFGWSDSAGIFMKVMQGRVLVEFIHSTHLPRVLPYTDDFLVLCTSKVEDGDQDIASVAHFGEHPLKVPWQRIRQIREGTQHLLSSATRKPRWVPARELTRFSGLCQSVYLAVRPRPGLERPGVVGSTAGRWQVECPQHQAVDHHGSSTHWRLPLRVAFGVDELEHHITHLELEAVSRTVQIFLQELRRRTVLLRCNNQAVVHMLAHFTSRDPALMCRVRRLWLVLHLHGIELLAKSIRSVASEWADKLSCNWFDWAQEYWGKRTVGLFASKISAQLPRYCTQWRDRGCEGTDSLLHDWRGECNWVSPTWALLDRVAQKLTEEWTSATAAAPRRRRQPWYRELEVAVDRAACMPRRRSLFTPSRLRGVRGARVLCGGCSNASSSRAPVSLFLKGARVWPPPMACYPEGMRLEETFWVMLPAAAAEGMREWGTALVDRWRTQLGRTRTPSNNYHEDLGYDGPVKGRSAVRMAKSMAALQAADLGYDSPVKGRSAVRMAKGMAALQAADLGLRTWGTTAPSKGAVAVHMAKSMAALQAADLARAQQQELEGEGVARCEGEAALGGSPGPHGASAGVPWESCERQPGSVGAAWLKQALEAHSRRPLEREHYTGHSTGKGAATSGIGVSVGFHLREPTPIPPRMLLGIFAVPCVCETGDDQPLMCTWPQTLLLTALFSTKVGINR
ncbi:hypothetical protein CYMTET_25846 [Cymbomonas tetramitiformis]|uniref:Uncharacterized protein n=1 Tax=Cymbomonas tetramitiformis TaxID=36881 RepID=A0AAE0FUK3_9CHLO|nr:hypothetical protein CYMTET_25846 [Cymbomonas tetramitiformis]